MCLSWKSGHVLQKQDAWEMDCIFFLASLSLFLAPIWWWPCGQLSTATLLIPTPRPSIAPLTVLATDPAGPLHIKKPPLPSYSRGTSIFCGEASSTFPAHFQADGQAWGGFWLGFCLFVCFSRKVVPSCFALTNFCQVAVFLMDFIHLCTQFCIQQSIQTI